MMRIAALALIFAEAFWGPAAAKDPTDADWMIRMMVCTQQNSPNMEVYLPQSIVFEKKPLAEALARPVIGYYTLDLSDANKGKSLEPVKVSMSADGKTVIVNQYTRGLPPTRIAARSTLTTASPQKRNAAPSSTRIRTTDNDSAGRLRPSSLLPWQEAWRQAGGPSY
jgi:hypothetical protein